MKPRKSSKKELERREALFWESINRGLISASVEIRKNRAKEKLKERVV